MKNKILFLLTIALFSINKKASAQSDKYVVYFTDKIGSNYSVSNPSAYLSARAIQRRLAQNIPIQADDLPVNQSYISQVANIGVSILNKSKWFNAISIQTSDINKINAIMNARTNLGHNAAPLLTLEALFCSLA